MYLVGKLSNTGGQAIENARAVDLVEGNTDIPGQDANAQGMAGVVPAIPDPERTTRKPDTRQVPCLVSFDDHRIEDDTDIFAEAYRQVEAGKDFAQCAAGDDLARIQHDQMVGESRHLIGCVTDVDDGNLEFVMQTFQVGQKFTLACRIESRQRLVHQQQSRTGQ